MESEANSFSHAKVSLWKGSIVYCSINFHSILNKTIPAAVLRTQILLLALLTVILFISNYFILLNLLQIILLNRFLAVTVVFSRIATLKTEEPCWIWPKIHLGQCYLGSELTQLCNVFQIKIVFLQPFAFLEGSFQLNVFPKIYLDPTPEKLVQMIFDCLTPSW